MVKNKLLKYKKAFAFSFLALFLSFLIFAYGGLFLFKGEHNKQTNFQESRISSIDNEIKYFKNTYSNNILDFVFYNSIFYLNDNSSNFKYFKSNYTALNNLIYEAMTNGSFNGTGQPNLVNKTINYFFNSYQKTFNKNYLANISFKIKKLNLYEDNPYYVSIQVLVNYNITTLDNISSWNFDETKFISVPVYNFKDPKFTQLTAFNYTIRPMSLYLSNINWSIPLFNKTMENVYSNIYFENTHKYTIGSSFIENLLNVSQSSYESVLGFYSFDYDENNPPFIYDTSGYSNQIRHFGNTRLLMSFDNSTINNLNIADLSAFNNSAVLYGLMNCSISGVYGNSCKFDGINDYINISKNKLNLNNTNKISISAWIKPNKYVDSISNLGSEIFKYGGGFNDVLDLRLTSNKKLQMEIGNHNGGAFKQFNSSSNISLNNWSHVVGSFDGNTGIAKLYINGKLNFISNSTSIINFIKSTNDIGIGNLVGLNERFNGSIDELAIYSKVLSNTEVAQIYDNRKATFIDYKPALYGKGLEFDGIDDYINLSKNLSVNQFKNNWSLGIWFKSYNLSGEKTLIKKNHPFFLETNNSKITGAVFDSVLGWVFISGSNIIKNQYYYSVLNWDSNNKILYLYLNGKLINQSSVLNGITSNIDGDLFIGVNKTSTSFNSYFNGIIDEVKIYNRSLNSDEVLRNYYNYASFSKGCCNYMSLINPNLMGFNSNLFKKNISYSSKVFFDHFKRGKPLPNVVIYNVTNVTSQITSKKYYNFLVDACIIEAYGITQIANITPLVTTINNSNTCSEIIKGGYY